MKKLLESFKKNLERLTKENLEVHIVPVDLDEAPPEEAYGDGYEAGRKYSDEEECGEEESKMEIKKSTLEKIIAEETSKFFTETLDWEETDDLGGTSTFYDRRVPGEEEGEHGRFAHPARQFEKDLQMLNMEPEGDLPSQKMRADGSRQFLDDAVASFKEQWESLALQDAADEIYARIKQNNLIPRPRAPIAEGSKGKHREDPTLRNRIAEAMEEGEPEVPADVKKVLDLIHDKVGQRLKTINLRAEKLEFVQAILDYLNMVPADMNTAVRNTITNDRKEKQNMKKNVPDTGALSAGAANESKIPIKLRKL